MRVPLTVTRLARLAVSLVAGVSLASGAGAGTTAGAQALASGAAPGHDYWLVPPSADQQGPAALARVRDAVLTTLRSSGSLPAGFPRAGRIVLTPLPAEPGVSRQSCEPGDAGAGNAVCLLLRPDGSFLNLSYRDYPDTQAYLFELYLVQKPPSRALKEKERYSLNRVVVHYPVIVGEAWTGSTATGPDLRMLVRQGLIQAGARPLAWKND